MSHIKNSGKSNRRDFLLLVFKCSAFFLSPREPAVALCIILIPENAVHVSHLGRLLGWSIGVCERPKIALRPLPSKIGA